MNGRVIGNSGTVPVTVPSVLIVRPGSTARLDLNFYFHLHDGFDRVSEFLEPSSRLSNAFGRTSPRRLRSIRTTAAFTIPGNGVATTTLSFSVHSNALPGTYLIEVNGTLSSSQLAQPERSVVLFFLYSLEWKRSMAATTSSHYNPDQWRRQPHDRVQHSRGAQTHRDDPASCRSSGEQGHSAGSGLQHAFDRSYSQRHVNNEPGLRSLRTGVRNRCGSLSGRLYSGKLKRDRGKVVPL